MTSENYASGTVSRGFPASVGPSIEGRRTVTRSDLAEAVFRRIGLSRLESAQLVEMVIGEVSENGT